MATNPITVMLVEDNPFDVELMLHAFKQVNLANNMLVMLDGLEVLTYFFGRNFAEPDPDQHSPLRSEIPQLILLDINMPRLSGLEVLKRLKTDTRTRNIPVVVLTASKEDQNLAKCYDLGANSYIVKPIDFEQFIHVAEQLSYQWLLFKQQPDD